MGKKILFCMPDNDDLLNILNSNCSAAVESIGEQVVDVGAVSDYDTLIAALASPEYADTDYVIVSERLVDEKGNSQSLGPAKLCEWVANFPRTRIIAVVSLKSKSKLVKLYQRGYYDVLMLENIDNSQVLAKLFKNRRTQVEAFAYYELDENFLNQEKKVVTEDKKSFSSNEPVVLQSLDNAVEDAVPVMEEVSEEMKPAEEIDEVQEPKIEVTNEEIMENSGFTAEQMNLSDIPDTGQYESVAAVEPNTVDGPYMDWATVNGYVSRVTGPDTIEVKLLNFNAQADAETTRLLLGSPSMTLVSLGMIEDTETGN